MLLLRPLLAAVALARERVALHVHPALPRIAFAQHERINKETLTLVMTRFRPHGVSGRTRGIQIKEHFTSF